MSSEDATEKAAQEFLSSVESILVDAIRLSREAHPSVFLRVAGLRRDLRFLFEDHARTRVEQERVRILDKISSVVKAL